MATIYFQDERIIKMKLTILNTGIGIFLLTALARGKNPLRAFIGAELHLPDAVVRTLTFRYALMFFVLAAANEVIWRTQTTRIWGLYKFPGTAALIFLFFLSQMPLILKHAPPDEPAQPLVGRRIFDIGALQAGSANNQPQFPLVHRASLEKLVQRKVNRRHVAL